MTSSVIYYSTETRKNEILNNSEHLIQIFQGKIFIQECQRRILRVGGGGEEAWLTRCNFFPILWTTNSHSNIIIIITIYKF